MYFFSKFRSWKRIAEQNYFVLLFSSNFRVLRKKFRVGGKNLGMVGQPEPQIFSGLTGMLLVNRIKIGGGGSVVHKIIQHDKS